MLKQTGRLTLKLDEPGRRLGLESVSKATAPLSSRLGCLTVILLIVAVVIWFTLPSPETVLVLEDRIIGLGVPAFVVLIALAFIRAVVFPSRQLLTLNVERNGEVCAVIGLPGTDSVNQQTCRTDDLESVELSVRFGSSGHSGSVFPLRLVLESRDGGQWLHQEIEVEGLDRREEALDLLARIATVLGLQYYRVVANDPSRLELRAMRRPGEVSERVPNLRMPANYNADVVDDGIEPLPEVTAPFDPSTTLPAGLAVVEWEPARRIVIARRWRIVESGVCTLLIAASAWAGVSAISPDAVVGGNIFIDWAGRWWDQSFRVGVEGATVFMRVVIGIVSAIGLVAAILIGQRVFDRTVADISAGNLAVRFGLRRRVMRIDQIASLELAKTVRTSVQHDDGGVSTVLVTHRKYYITVKCHDGTAVPVLRFYSTTGFGTAEKFFNRLYPFVVAFAQALRVPHNYQPPD